MASCLPLPRALKTDPSSCVNELSPSQYFCSSYIIRRYGAASPRRTVGGASSGRLLELVPNAAYEPTPTTQQFASTQGRPVGRYYVRDSHNTWHRRMEKAMTVSTDALLDAIETSLFSLPQVPGRIQHLDIPHIQGHVTPFPDANANTVGAATLTRDNADETIRQVRDLFAGQNKGFSWLVGPRTTPADLGSRLTRAGLVKEEEMAGMVLTDLHAPIQANPEVTIRQGTTAEMLEASAIIARAYGGFSEEYSRLRTEALMMYGGELRVRGYLAYVQGNSDPVAFSYLAHIPGQPIVLMYGAATLNEHRGRGIYTSLAARDTSAPICVKLGFREVCSLELYVWAPEEPEQVSGISSHKGLGVSSSA
jgi:hypothetical protein